MDTLLRKTHTTSRSLTYTYYITLHKSNAPTLLLQHGFPDDHNLWKKMIPGLLQLNHPIIVPDLLGYGGSSKPLDTALYNSKGMADDLAELLQHENITSIISVGHDWGSYIATRMYLWHPELVVGVVLLNTVYSVPFEFDLDRANTSAEKRTGSPTLAYWEFFIAEDAPRIMNANVTSMWSSLHSRSDDWQRLLCNRGSLHSFVEDGRTIDTYEYAKNDVLKKDWVARFQDNGFEAPVQWYLAQVQNHHWKVEKSLPCERSVISVPFLFVGATDDAIAPPDAIDYPSKAGYLPQLTKKILKCGHWQPMETPEETVDIMATWLQEQDFPHQIESKL